MESHVRKPENLTAQFKLIRRMFKFTAPVKFHIAVVIAIFIVYAAAETTTVYLLKPAVNAIEKISQAPPLSESIGIWEWITSPTSPGAGLRKALLWLLAAKLITSVLSWAKTVSSNWQNMSMVYYMRAAVYDRLQRVGFSFHDQYSTGQLINRALGDLQSVRNFVNVAMHASADMTFAVVFYLIMLYSFCSPKLALYALIPLPFWCLAIRRFAITMQPVYQKQVKASDTMVGILTENIAGVHVVRAFATENLEHEKFKGSCDTLLGWLLKAVRIRVIMNPVVRVIAHTAHIWLYAIAAVYVQEGKLAIGDLLILGSAMWSILGKMHQINSIADSYQAAVVSSYRLFEILDSKDTTPQPADAEPLRPGGGAVRFNHVSFSYKPGEPVLTDISFSVPAGSVVALVGPTGSGKTTLANLLGRFYDPEMGEVHIDGQDLRDVTVKSVRESVGYVFQETYLFSDSIARNIAYGDSDASIENIKQAARIARADEFIEKLPKKYDNLIGEYGASLSGGQKQRLAIARAVLHNPRILVMDDALAAVDPETEAIIRSGLERIMAGRTVFLIASRISTARRAHRILVIERGRIAQSGTHDELMQQAGYYRDVAASQFASTGAGQGASHMDRMVRRSAKQSNRVLDD
ncbi:MAG TPA: ABC transporter ATP-binding protein [Planctomycetota bacterium]